MKFTSYDGISFSSLNVSAGVPADLPGPDLSPVLIERYGTAPVYAGMGRGSRTIPLEFVPLPGYATEATLMALLAKLDPFDERERLLVGELNNGTAVQVSAAVGSFVYTDVNTVQVQFYVAEPTWKKTTRAYSPGPAATDYTAFTANGSLAVTNTGQTGAMPVVRLKWTGTQRSSGETASFGYKYRRTIAVTNNGTRTLRRYPLYLDLDDTKAWVDASKALASGDDIRIFCNGRELPRTLIGHNDTILRGTVAAGTTRSAIVVSGTNPLGSPATNYAGYQVVIRDGALAGESVEIASNTSSTLTLSEKLSAIPANGVKFALRNTWAWTVVDEIRAGETITLEVVYGNPTPGTPPTLSGTDMPAFDLARSSNATWRYKLGGEGKTASATAGRGLWYVNPNGNEVTGLSWDVPGAWQRMTYLDNRDDRTQLRSARVTASYTTTTANSTTTSLRISGASFATNQWAGARCVVTIGGTDYTRYVESNDDNDLVLTTALPSAPNSTNAVKLSVNVGRFDARRTWQDNAQYPEEGAYDGVMLGHPLGIKSLQGAYALTNPASIAKFVILSRGSGAEDWAKDAEKTSTTASTAIDLDWDAGTYPVQIGLALSANDDVVIPTSYAKDSGTASAGAATYIEDETKSWAGTGTSGQWVNGKVKLVGGKGKGQQRTIAESSSSRLTISGSNFSPVPDDTTRYIVTADHKASASLTGNYLTVTFNRANLSVGDISDPETAVYDVGKGNATDGWLTLRMGGGASATSYPHYLARIGGSGRRLFLASGEILRLDAANRTVRLYNSSETTYTSVPWAVDFYQVTAEGTARTTEWLPVRAADSKVYVTNPVWGGSSLSLEVDLQEAFLG